MRKRTLRHNTKHIDRRLRFSIQIYLLISIILVCLLIYNIFVGSLGILFAVIGLGTGILLGFIASRIYHLSWSKDGKKVVSRMDVFGIIILVLYVAFEIFRGQIVGHFTHGVQVGSIGFAILAGIMFGRVIGTRGRIMKILTEQKILT